MKIKYQALLLTLLMLIAGLSIADEDESGKVTSIDRENLVIEINGKRYLCPRKMVQGIEYGERLKLDDVAAECERE